MTKHILILGAMLLGLQNLLPAQNDNGQLDQPEELGQRQTVQIPLPGGGFLATDVYLPITADSQVVEIPLFGQTYTLELIPKNTQIVVYPEYIDATGQRRPNPNPYQLPLLFSRTPYGKNGITPGGHIVPLLGYAFAFQDVRGRGESGGVYLPMYSDAWAKAPYNPHNHLLDISNSTDSANGRFHEDGWTTYRYFLDSLDRDFDLNNDGIPETRARLHNGTLGMAGASAFGIPHLQLAATRRFDPQAQGLRGMLSLVATGEHYNCTGYHNGVFRDELIYGWLDGQFNDLNDTATTDNSLQNALHTPSDFGQLSTQAVLDLAADHISSYRYPGSPVANAYPNSPLRREMDISRAKVNAQGEGDANGQESRYRNMALPSYHLTGWYDIFVDGQIRTWQQMRAETGQPHKLIIGPWAHTTISAQESGDVVYPSNVTEPLGLDLTGVGLDDPTSLDLSQILQLEPLSFLRYCLNANGYQRLGEPVFRIPESQRWQQAGALRVRLPSRNYEVQLIQVLNFAVGQGSLPNLPLEVDLGFGIRQTVNVPVPAFLGTLVPISSTTPIQPIRELDFRTQVPDLRFYVIGPYDSLSTVGNYWLQAPDFPPTQGIRYDSFYLHANGSLDERRPQSDEGWLGYTHDPNNPVQSVGGNNLFLKTPDRSRDSHGQMDYANPDFEALTMNRPDVLRFETQPLADTLSMMGFPKATLFVRSSPNGGPAETDTDFFVRLLDVYPDGREILVVEGAVNARAREYARSLYQGQENDQAPFSNILADSLYELQFDLLPIAYTFERGHKLKVLVSSSNYPRYRSNPNLPMADGDFFRCQPNDGKLYRYQGQDLAPRTAQNALRFAPEYPSRLELPTYNRPVPVATQALAEAKASWQLFPNPSAGNWVQLQGQEPGFTWQVFDIQGRILRQGQTEEAETRLNLEGLAAGTYQVRVQNNKGQIQLIPFIKS